MEMSGEFRIPAPKEKVWAALNDPEILRQSVPGCQSITKLSDTEMEGAVTASVGPVKATFKGSVVLSDIDAPNSYTLTGQGKGGAAGFVKGVAKVSLAEENGATVLRYRSEASVGGGASTSAASRAPPPRSALKLPKNSSESFFAVPSIRR